jgi:S1-C subfamily serine protease
MPFDRKAAEGALIEVLDGLTGERVVALGFRLLDGVLATACHALPRAAGKVVLPDPDRADREPILVRVRLPGTARSAAAALLAADPCSDLALLGVPPAGAGAPRGPPPALTLQELLPSLTRVRLAPAPPQEGRIFVHTHERRWVEGTVRAGAISIPRPSERIRSATSGAPVFDDEGRVVGLVGTNDVRLPEAALCRLADRLPGWALRRALES